MAGAMKKPLLILGCGGQARVVSDVARALGYCNLTYLDTTGQATSFLGQPVHHEQPSDYHGQFFVAVGDNWQRQQLHDAFMEANPGACAAALIHPSCVIGSDCTIGAGSVLMPLCVVNAGSRIGAGVILNTRSSVDHDGWVDAFASLAPGCVLGGQVRVGRRSALGLACVVRHQITIGEDVVVGASSFVNRDLADCCVAYGIPARPVRWRQPEDPYL